MSTKRTRKRLKKSHYTRRVGITTAHLLAKMKSTGYMKFSLDCVNDPELFAATVECTGDFAIPDRRSYFLGSKHHYKFTVALCNPDGDVLSENDYYVADPVDHHEFEQVIRGLVENQLKDFDNPEILSGKHSTVKLSVYNPNLKEHL